MDACTFDFQLVDHLHLFLALVTHLRGPYHCLEVLNLGTPELRIRKGGMGQQWPLALEMRSLLKLEEPP